jgi:hypothetical protein
MKTLLAVLLTFVSVTALAQANLDTLSGSWKSNCVQSQMYGKQGFTTEQYTFKAIGEYSLVREWFKDPTCDQGSFDQDTETGTVKLGNENTNNGFNPGNTLEADFKHGSSTDLGLIWLDKNGSTVRVARGMGNMRNTMLSLFSYSKN